MATIRKFWRCSCRDSQGKQRGYKKVYLGEKSCTCKHCGNAMYLTENFTARLTANGRERARSITSRKADAEAYLNEAKVAIRTKRLLPGEERFIPWETAVADFAKWFNQDQAKPPVAFDTARMYKGCIKQLDPFFKNLTLQEISKKMALDFQTERSQTRKEATVNRDMATLKRMFSLHCQWYSAREYPLLHAIATDIMNIPLLAENNTRERYLTAEEIPLLLSRLKAPVRTIVYAGFKSGLRPENLVGLKKSHIDFKNMEFKIPREEMKRKKGHKFFVAPIEEELAAELKAWIIQHNTFNYLFVSPKNPDTHISYSWVCHEVRKGIIAAGLNIGQDERLTLTTATRHSFATNLLDGEASLDDVSMLLDHATTAITKKRYIKHVRERLKNTMNTAGHKLSIRKEESGRIS